MAGHKIPSVAPHYAYVWGEGLTAVYPKHVLKTQLTIAALLGIPLSLPLKASNVHVFPLNYGPELIAHLLWPAPTTPHLPVWQVDQPAKTPPASCLWTDNVVVQFADEDGEALNPSHYAWVVPSFSQAIVLLELFGDPPPHAYPLLSFYSSLALDTMPELAYTK